MESQDVRRSRRPARRGPSLVATGVAAVLVLGACTGGRELSATGPTVPTTEAETTTTVVAVTEAPQVSTSAPPAPAASTAAPRTVGTTPARKPVHHVNGVPQVTASPPRGAVGATVHLDGYGFTDEHWRDPEPSLWLTGGDSECLVYADAEHTVRVTPDGRLHGDFVVPGRGGCRQSEVGEVALSPGTYAIVYQCTPCVVGTFEVTGSTASASAECQTVGFTPQTEDAASSIVATGLSCDQAEAFLRRLGPSVSATGPARIEHEGFECVLTRHEPEPLPQGFYECTSGSKRITFVRS